MTIAGMKIALQSCREMVQSLSGRMIQCKGDEIRKVARDEEAHLARGEAVVPHPAFVRKVVNDVGG